MIGPSNAGGKPALAGLSPPGIDETGDQPLAGVDRHLQ